MKNTTIQNIKTIILRRKHNVNCTPSEIDKVTQFLHKFKMWEVDNVALATEIAEFFPKETKVVIKDMLACEERKYLENLL